MTTNAISHTAPQWKWEVQNNIGEVVPSDQEEEVDEAFFRQMEEASCLRALILMEDFICLGTH